MRIKHRCVLAVVAGLVAVSFAPRPTAAQEVNKVVRALDRILNPQDARRYEERARREHRPEEQRYWHDYGAGLEEKRASRRHESEQARRYEEQARHNRRPEEERYWRDYRRGLDERR